MAGGFYKLLLCEFVLQVGEGGFNAGVVDQILVALLVAGEVVALGPEQSIGDGLLAVCWMKEGPKTRILSAVSAEAVRIPNGSNHHLLKFALICPPSWRSGTPHDILRLKCLLYKTTLTAPAKGLFRSRG